MNNNDDPGTIYVGWDNARPHIDGKPVWHKGFSTPTQANTFISERLAEREANRALAHKATEELSAIFRGAPALNHNSTFSEDMAEVYNGPAAPDVNLMGTFASIKMAQKAALQEDLLREDLRPAIDDDSPPWDVKPFSN